MNFQKTDNRLQFRFWLDALRPDEEELAHYVETLKNKRRFAQTIRDALRLIRDLRKGQIEVLLFFFPWIEDYFKAKYSQPTPDNSIKQQLDFLTQMLLEGGATPIQPGQRQLLAPPPSEDDISAKMDIQESKGDERWGDAKGRHNLLLGLNADDPQKWDNLPTDTFEYGLEMGKFPARLVAQAQQKLQERQQKSGNAKKMAGADIVFTSAPDDDLDLSLLG